ncbi:unnamed protein product [Sphagnum tenellum]
MTSHGRRLVDALKRVATKPARHHLTEDILEATYCIGVNRAELTSDEKREAGPLIKSALKFMLDGFGSFPVSSTEVLKDSLEFLERSEGLKSFDEELANLKDDTSTPVTVEDFSFSKLVMALELWEKSAKATQQTFANLLGDRTWDSFSIPGEKRLLWDKIAYAFCGNPKDANASNRGYSEDEVEFVNDILEKCLAKKSGGQVNIAFLFVCAFKSLFQEAVVPLIRIKYDKSPNIELSDFIDHCGRTYDRWSKYLAENTFDTWWICVPKGATYGDGFEPRFHDQTNRGDVLEVADAVSTVSNITTSLTMVAGTIMSFFPPTAPLGIPLVISSAIVGAPGAVYGTGRSVCKLVDRGVHDQSINPFTNAEARACWLCTAASALSIGVMASTKLLTMTASVGKLAGSGTRLFCTALNVTCLTVNGLGVVNSFVEIAKKGDKMTPLDVLQLTTSIFFFTHACVNFQTASSIIKDAQGRKIAMERSKLGSEQHEAFDAMLKGERERVEPGETREMHGNKEFIRSIQKIDDKQAFFSHFKIVADQQLSIHDELVIDPKAFLQMNEGDKNTILVQSKNLKEGRISQEDFDSSINNIRREYRITSERNRAQARASLCECLGVDELGDVNINGNNILKDIKPHEVDRLDQVFKEAGKKYDRTCVEAGLKLAREMGSENVTELAAQMEYCIRKLDAEVGRRNGTDPNPVGKPRGMSNKNFYRDEVYKEFINGEHLQRNMCKEFRELMVACEKAQGNTGRPRFANPSAAANHYDKHQKMPKVDQTSGVSPEIYFEIAQEMTCGISVSNPKWTQDGTSLVYEFVSDKYGAMSIRYDNLANKTSVIATLMAKNVVKDIRGYDFPQG